MNFEKSCGGVVFTRINGVVHYVIIRHLGGHCGFPKGHMETGESERDTALREIQEETGLSVNLKGGFRMAEQYPLPNKPGIRKQVVYFLGEYHNQEIHFQPEEVSAVYLLPYAQAMETLPFPEARRVLEKANQTLEKT